MSVFAVLPFNLMETVSNVSSTDVIIIRMCLNMHFRKVACVYTQQKGSQICPLWRAVAKMFKVTDFLPSLQDETSVANHCLYELHCQPELAAAWQSA